MRPVTWRPRGCHPPPGLPPRGKDLSPPEKPPPQIRDVLRVPVDDEGRQIELDRDSLICLETIGWLLTACGNWDRGPAVAREAVGRNPHHTPDVSLAFWLDHLRAGEFEQAYAAALGYRDTGFFWRSLMRACCLGHLGRTAEAGREAAELLRQKPEFTSRGRFLTAHLVKFPDLQERVVEGLARAGLRLSR